MMAVQGCYGPILGAGTDTTPGRLTSVLARGMWCCALEHASKISWDGFMDDRTLEQGLEASIDFSRGQSRQWVF